jgi:hypothetical protein
VPVVREERKLWFRFEVETGLDFLQRGQFVVVDLSSFWPTLVLMLLHHNVFCPIFFCSSIARYPIVALVADVKLFLCLFL